MLACPPCLAGMGNSITCRSISSPLVTIAWKAILSSKGILPLLWEMFPGHPNLLPAYFAHDPKRAALGDSYVGKPLHSREGANVKIVVAENVIDAGEGPYGDEPIILQAVGPLPVLDGTNRDLWISHIRLVWGFLCQGRHAIFCSPFVIPFFHSFVRPAPRAFFRPDRISPSPSRAAAVKDGASSAPPKACP